MEYSGLRCCEKYDGQTTVIEQKKTLHSSKIVCKHCGRFLNWNKITEQKQPKKNNVVQTKEKKPRKKFICCDKYDGTTKIISKVGGIHEQRAVCAHCEHFIKWLPSERKNERHNIRKLEIDSLLEKQNKRTINLSDKEQNFLKNIYENPAITPSQWAYFEHLKLKFLHL
jgi:hypothetical protein